MLSADCGGARRGLITSVPFLQHEIDVGANGVARDSGTVRTYETRAYTVQRSLDKGFGREWKGSRFRNAVDGSVRNWGIKNAAGQFVDAVLNGGEK
jgi:hypothetical protein